MKRFLPIVMLLMTGAVVAPVKADLVHRLSTSTSLTVDGALTVGTRLGSTYAVSGSNIEVPDGAHFGTMTVGSATAAPTQDLGGYAIKTAGSAFSFSGVAGTLAGTLTSAGAVTLTAGGAGTNATGQFVSEITIN